MYYKSNLKGEQKRCVDVMVVTDVIIVEVAAAAIAVTGVM